MFTENRIRIILLCMTLTLVTNLSAEAPPNARGANLPHIVLFISDDHGYEDAGIYGNGVIRTPNIDQLAGEGLTFTHAFAASPLCSPSRCVIETGLMPFRNGGHKFNSPISEDIKTMPKYFKELDYYTAEIGKFHHAPNRKFPYDFVDGDENVAASFIRDYSHDRPMFLVVCTHPPHTPWVKNRSYDPGEIPLPPNFIDTPETREDLARYYSDVTLMDSILGNVMHALEERDMAKNTLFIYTSDQGSNWPFSKWTVYDGGMRVPFIARWPGEIRSGSWTGAMISLTDILPTCMEAAGAAPASGIDGRSIMGVLRGTENQHREYVFGTHTGNDNGGPGIWNHCPARMVRSREYKYILNLEPDSIFTTHITGSPEQSIHYLSFWKTWEKEAESSETAYQLVYRYLHRPMEELYDVQRDPYEMINLAGNPEYLEIQGELKQELARWRLSQRDTIAVNGYYNHQVK